MTEIESYSFVNRKIEGLLDKLRVLGLRGRTTNPTAGSDASRMDAFADKLGKLAIIQNAPRELIVDNYITLTSTTGTTLLSAGGSGVLVDLVELPMVNTSATDVRVDFRDATGGSVKFSQIAKTVDNRGFVFAVPKPQTTANNNWTAQLASAVTDVRIYALGFKNV